MIDKLKCGGCGKPMKPMVFDEDDDGLEGYIARNLPEPDAVFCSSECCDIGRAN